MFPAAFKLLPPVASHSCASCSLLSILEPIKQFAVKFFSNFFFDYGEPLDLLRDIEGNQFSKKFSSPSFAF